MGFSRQEYWSGSPFPSPEYLPDQGSNMGLLHYKQILCHLSHQGSPLEHFSLLKNNPRDFPCGPEVRSSPRGSDGRSICLQCGRPGFDPWMGKILWRRKWQLTPGPLPGKFHGWRSLVGYGPWGHRVGHDWSDLAQHNTAEREVIYNLSFVQIFMFHGKNISVCSLCCPRLLHM